MNNDLLKKSIKILIVVAICLVLFGVFILVMNHFKKKQAINNTADEILQEYETTKPEVPDTDTAPKPVVQDVPDMSDNGNYGEDAAPENLTDKTVVIDGKEYTIHVGGESE